MSRRSARSKRQLSESDDDDDSDDDFEDKAAKSKAPTRSQRGRGRPRKKKVSSDDDDDDEDDDKSDKDDGSGSDFEEEKPEPKKKRSRIKKVSSSSSDEDGGNKTPTAVITEAQASDQRPDGQNATATNPQQPTMLDMSQNGSVKVDPETSSRSEKSLDDPNSDAKRLPDSPPSQLAIITQLQEYIVAQNKQIEDLTLENRKLKAALQQATVSRQQPPVISGRPVQRGILQLCQQRQPNGSIRPFLRVMVQATRPTGQS